ncbi:curlin subunit CsgB [Rhodopseudomonas palustris]|uniref:Curlin subunit CsgB n=1 Tax=Rhodopseudomonas palustris TaxID=1076 RepID=A0A323UAP5_RHOPL|nr:curlin subunit CsgB [Rhodopseudomonas palustris]PZA09894.1 curlin subunit CsgB [Rhodopseudomonas palustris]
MTASMQQMRPAARRVAVAMLGLGAFIGMASAQSADLYTDLSGYLVSRAQQGMFADGALPSGNHNTAIASQTGNANSVTSDVHGSLNATLQSQLGSGNDSSFIVNGNQNVLHNSQIGDSNSARIDVTGSRNAYSSTQIGSNLSYGLSQVGNNGGAVIVQMGGHR